MSKKDFNFSLEYIFSEYSRMGYFVGFYTPQYLQTLFLKQFQ